jgi:non-specific protein-tyrosine kinase
VSRHSEYGRIVRQDGWIAALTVVVALLASAVVTARQERVYQASTTLVVTPTSEVEGAGDILRSLETLERRSVIATFARIPSTPAARATAAERLARPLSELGGYRVEGSVLPSTNILKIDVEGPDGALAASLANALATATKDEVKSLYRIFTLKVLAEARAPSRPVRPDPQRNYVVAAIGGLLLGVAAAVVAERWRGGRVPGA